MDEAKSGVLLAQERKAQLVERLREEEIPAWLDDVDARLRTYIEGVKWHCEGEDDIHNVDEVAACCRFLRMCRVYRFDVQHVRRYVKMAESLKMDSIDGKKCYKLTPSQVFVVAGTHGFLKQVRVQRGNEAKLEMRKVVKESIMFIPRKWSKTQIDAWEAIDDFLFGENDAEVHIVSNAFDQSQIAFRQIKSLLEQIDPKGKEIRMTAKEISWKKGRKAVIYCHTAGGKTKDGAKASKVIGDEYGSAGYVKDHCDMSNAINVYESSMGPRANGLSVISTTAGRVLQGPFEQKLKAAQEALYGELKAGWDEELVTDMQFVFALHPDEWEYDDDHYGCERVWKKVNPHLGITIQSTYYRDMWERCKGDPELYKEVVTKLFNQFVSDSSRPWIEQNRVRDLQCGKTIRDLKRSDWYCFISCDFSKGDDLCCLSYTCYNGKTGQYFMDCTAWIAEEQLYNNPNAVLYEMWIQQGWLRVCPGGIIDETMVLKELDEVNQCVSIMSIGYDPYDSLRFVNLFKTWLVTKISGKLRGHKMEDFLKRTIRPVRQNRATFSAPCQVMRDLLYWPEQKVWMSGNPLLPWCFGNCVLIEDQMGNVKPEKRTANAKIDVVICLLMNIVMIEEWKL